MTDATGYMQQGTWPAAGCARASAGSALLIATVAKPRPNGFATVSNHRSRRPRGPSS